MRWWAVPLLAIGLVHAASAGEFDSGGLRGSIGPGDQTFPAASPHLSSSDQALRSMLVNGQSSPAAATSSPAAPTPFMADPSATVRDSSSDGADRSLAAADPTPTGSIPPPAWSWTGFYVGAHLGGALSLTDFSDPFGPSIFGDTVRSTGFVGGGQLGYNRQLPNKRWVVGVEADVSALDSEGTNTCLAYSAYSVSANCHVQPKATGSLAARVGYAATSSGHTLVYVKGGGAWINEDVDITTNGYTSSSSTSANRTRLGWTIGAGLEQALTPAWSLGVEYDYRQFASGGFPTPTGALYIPGSPGYFVATSGSVTRISRAFEQVKLGLNYKIGTHPWARFKARGPISPFDPRFEDGTLGPVWETELGVRYVYGLGRFEKSLTPPSLVSRLTYDDMKTHAGEVFARIDTPRNLMIKGMYGIGRSKGGHMNDEDWGIGDILLGYSNTLSSSAKNSVEYWTVDVGFDLLRTRDHKLTPFVGYNEFHEDMSAYGCTPISAGNCIPAVPAAGSAIITEKDVWRSLRFGVAAQTMLTPRVKLSGEVAYLPYVKFTGADNHLFGNSGILGEVFPEAGTGRGVQLEALVSYYLTKQFSLGLGGRYWTMWTTNGQYNCSYGAPGTPCAGAAPTPEFPFSAAVEQTSVFAQASYQLQAR